MNYLNQISEHISISFHYLTSSARALIGLPDKKREELNPLNSRFIESENSRSRIKQETPSTDTDSAEDSFQPFKSTPTISHVPVTAPFSPGSRARLLNSKANPNWERLESLRESLIWSQWLDPKSAHSAHKQIEREFVRHLACSVYGWPHSEKAFNLLTEFVSARRTHAFVRAIISQLKGRKPVVGADEQGKLVSELVDQKLLEALESEPILTWQEAYDAGLDLPNLALQARPEYNALVTALQFDCSAEETSEGSEYSPRSIIAVYIAVRDLCYQSETKSPSSLITGLVFNRNLVKMFQSLSREAFAKAIQDEVQLADRLLVEGKRSSMISEESLMSGDLIDVQIALNRSLTLIQTHQLAARDALEFAIFLARFAADFAKKDACLFHSFINFALSKETNDQILACSKIRFSVETISDLSHEIRDLLDENRLKQLAILLKNPFIRDLTSLGHSHRKNTKDRIWMRDTDHALDCLEAVVLFSSLHDAIRKCEPKEPDLFLQWAFIQTHLEPIRTQIEKYREEIFIEAGIAIGVMHPTSHVAGRILLPGINAQIMDNIVNLVAARLVLVKSRHPVGYTPSIENLNEMYSTASNLEEYFADTIRVIQNLNHLPLGHPPSVPQPKAGQARSEEATRGLEKLHAIARRLIS